MNVGKNWGRDNPIPLLSTLWLNSDSWSVECLLFFKKNTQQEGDWAVASNVIRRVIYYYICYSEGCKRWVKSDPPHFEETWNLPLKIRYPGCQRRSRPLGPPWLCAWLQSACGEQAVSSDRASVHVGKFHCGCFPVSPEECRGWPSGRLNE